MDEVQKRMFHQWVTYHCWSRIELNLNPSYL